MNASRPAARAIFDQVSDQVCRDAQLLMGVVDRKRDLGATGMRDDISCAAHDDLLSAFGEYGDQRDVVGEVDIEEEFDLALAEAALWRKEPPVKRLLAESSDRGKHLRSVVRLQSPDVQHRAVAQAFCGGVLGGVHGLLVPCVLASNA